MQRLSRANLFRNHQNLELPTTPPLMVTLGETFEIETADSDDRGVRGAADIDKPAGPMAGNPWTGPVYVEGIARGEVIAVTIEDLCVDDHCLLPIGDTALLLHEKVRPCRAHLLTS